MKHSYKKALSLIVFFAMLILFGGCVAEQGESNEYDRIFDYWCKNWYGWYEITEATGKFAPLNGTRADCTAVFATTKFFGEIQLTVHDQNGDDIFFFDGEYANAKDRANGEIKLGKLSIANALLGDDSGKWHNEMPIEFDVDGESHGINGLAAIKGDASDGGDTVKMELYIRHWGADWDDLHAYTGDVFGQRQYPAFLPPDYNKYVKYQKEEEPRNKALSLWAKEWQGWYSIANATGEFSGLNTAKTNCTVKLGNYLDLSNRLNYSYTFYITSEDQKTKLSIKGLWSPNKATELGEVLFEACAIGGTEYPAQGDIDALSHGIEDMAVMHTQVDCEAGGFKLCLYLRPNGTGWDDISAITDTIVDGMTGEQLLPLEYSPNAQ